MLNFKTFFHFLILYNCLKSYFFVFFGIDLCFSMVYNHYTTEKIIYQERI